MARIVLKLARDPAPRAALGEENRRRVGDEYDPARMFEETAALLADTVRPQGRPRRARAR